MQKSDPLFYAHTAGYFRVGPFDPGIPATGQLLLLHQQNRQLAQRTALQSGISEIGVTIQKFGKSIAGLYIC